ncbi:hypothetical protein [Streptomyces chattanoogensis]|uniref:SMI1/KNR4 family protein n=1 Tax=Streptomyces chattanoogensis TaxID=66876 RepID=A0A0N0Y0J1_9ACTN|nr:hypothetical protein [Streptomyces chattanoogensis]KPC67213.1 hypothetical protein ADL29_00845 [Streptomyces chattanoogensis]
MTDAYSPIPELNLLKEFEERVGAHRYADGFSLLNFEYNRKDHLGSSSRNPDDAELIDRLIPFAEATAGGSVWALWRHDDRSDLAALPVVFLGDEGDTWVHARDLREFFRLIPVNREFMDEGEEEDLDRLFPDRQQYLAWLHRHFGLTAPDEEEEAALIEAAMGEYGRPFAAWLRRFPSHEGVAEEMTGLLEDYGIPSSPEPA